MNKRNVNGVIKVLLVAILLGVLSPAIARAQSDSERIKNLEAAVKTLQDELKGDRPQGEAGPTDYRVFWKEGLNLATADGDFKMKIGGRIMWDSTWASEDSDIKNDVVPAGGSALGDQEDGTEFRRVRLYTSGLIYDNVEFKLQFDFAGGDAVLKDAYVGLIDFPIGRIRAGHFKEPFGLEMLTSSKYITFIERSLPTGAFTPSRNAGIMLFGNALADPKPRMTWAAGIFKETDNHGEVHDDGGYSLTGRLTGLPWYKDKGASLLHVGVAFSARDTTDTGITNDQSYDTEPEAHLLDNFVDTGSFASDSTQLLGLEAAWVKGPLSVQSEYIRADADTSSGTGNFSGYYIQASYFLTGEHRKYKPSAGAFSRVKPKENYAHGGGLGAWEVALRYSSIDLDDSNVDGGELENITLGLNWYLNPNTRIMCNYVRADKDDVGYADIFVTRLQIDF